MGGRQTFFPGKGGERKEPNNTANWKKGAEGKFIKASWKEISFPRPRWHHSTQPLHKEEGHRMLVGGPNGGDGSRQCGAWGVNKKCTEGAWCGTGEGGSTIQAQKRKSVTHCRRVDEETATSLWVGGRARGKKKSAGKNNVKRCILIQQGTQQFLDERRRAGRGGVHILVAGGVSCRRWGGDRQLLC